MKKTALEKYLEAKAAVESMRDAQIKKEEEKRKKGKRPEEKHGESKPGTKN